MLDDILNRKNKPSSQAEHPIEATGFHFSHKDHKKVWGHQIAEMNADSNRKILCFIKTSISIYETDNV